MPATRFAQPSRRPRQPARAASAFVALLCLAGLAAGCHGVQTAGIPIPQASPVTIADAKSLDSRDGKQPVVLTGRVTIVCPISGCWLKIRDTTGEIRVDIKDAGFTATGIPTGTDVTLVGTIERVDGDAQLVGSGLRW